MKKNNWPKLSFILFIFIIILVSHHKGEAQNLGLLDSCTSKDGRREKAKCWNDFIDTRQDGWRNLNPSQREWALEHLYTVHADDYKACEDINTDEIRRVSCFRDILAKAGIWARGFSNGIKKCRDDNKNFLEGITNCYIGITKELDDQLKYEKCETGDDLERKNCFSQVLVDAGLKGEKPYPPWRHGECEYKYSDDGDKADCLRMIIDDLTIVKAVTSHPQITTTDTGDTSPTPTGTPTQGDTIDDNQTASQGNIRLLKCGPEVPCVCRPHKGDLYPGLEEWLVQDLYSANWLPRCQRGVRPNGSIIEGAEGYAWASESDQNNIQQRYYEITETIDKFRESRNSCDLSTGSFVQYCRSSDPNQPANTMLQSCFLLAGALESLEKLATQKNQENPSPTEKFTPEKFISPFEMGIMQAQAEQCRREQAQCLAPQDGSRVTRDGVIENDKQVRREAFLSALKTSDSLVQDYLDLGTTKAKPGAKGSVSVVGPLFKMGLAVGSGRASRADEVLMAIGEAGCDAFIPGCPISLFSAFAEGNAAKAGVQLFSAVNGIAAAVMGGPGTMAVAVAAQLASVLIDISKPPPCLADIAKNTEQKVKDKLSLENYTKEDTEGMGEDMRRQAEFNQGYREQSWNDQTLNECKAVPRNAQFPAWTNTLCENSTTSHAFECDWLQWCKKRQDELGMEPDPYLTHAERQYLSANPPRNDNCLEKCIELKEHAEKTNQGQVSCDKANLDYFLQIALCRLN